MITHKHPRVIGIYRAYITGFPIPGYVGIGVHPCLSPECLPNKRLGLDRDH